MNVKFEQNDAVKVMAFLEEGILAHVVNDLGVMSAGIAYDIAKEWPIVEQHYKDAVSARTKEDLHGKIQFVPVTKKLIVGNMFAQHGIHTGTVTRLLNYDWLEECLKKLFEFAVENKWHIRIPRIGAGLAGGNWDKIWHMIITIGLPYDVDLTLHQLTK